MRSSASNSSQRCLAGFRSVQNSQVLSHTGLCKPFLMDLTMMKFTKLLGSCKSLSREIASVCNRCSRNSHVYLVDQCVISVWSVCERFPVLFLISSSPPSSSLHNRAHLVSRRGWNILTWLFCSTSAIGISMTDLDRQPCGLSNFAVNVAKKCFRQTQLHDEIVCPHAWITRRWELEPVEPN